MSSKQKQASPSTSFSFVDAEHDMLQFWETHSVFQASLEQSKDKPKFVFYDGPPFATGLPHHGHLVASTIKDIIPRYQTMLGHYVERRFGWDCHGLPIEHEIDKSLGMSAKEAVEKFGIAKYNDECRGIVQRYTQEWEKTITRLGRWVDFDNDYRTLEPWYMESVWWVFKQLWDKGLVYQGEKVVAYSTELETVLSNFEATSNYKDVQDPAISVLFKLEDEDCYLAAWTTTPWTLPSNLALCVNPDFDYVKVLDQSVGKKFWIAKELLESFSKGRSVEVLATTKGSDLASKSYTPIFPYFVQHKAKGAFKVLADTFVSQESGTGIVHMAPAFGEEDQRVCRENGIEVSVCPLDSRGRFTSEVSDFARVYVKDADKSIIQTIKERGLLYRHDTLMHSYPFCPRSDTPIIYRTVPSWYIGVTQLRDKLVENNNKIKWVPEHIQQGRMGKWLENAIDWAVSRNRYWGTPLPIWINDVTDKPYCVGSIEELTSLTGAQIEDLHRDHIDHLTFTLAGEDGVYRRIPEVFDCWFESGSMPYAQVHYPFENKQEFEASFPASFIAEGVDQTRGWFYTLQVLSECLFGKPAFTNVIVNGIVMAEDGKKMSKRLKNYTAPDILMEQYGADALRLYLINSGLVKAEEQKFSDKGVQEMVRQVLLPWYNGFKFFKTYADIDGWKVDDSAPTRNVLDRWIVSRLESLKEKVNAEMQAYHLYEVVPALFEFMEDLTNWYIRLNRARYWQPDMNKDKESAYATLYYCLDTFTTLMAPFTPFLSEFIYQQLKEYDENAERPLSVHLRRYPQTVRELKLPELETSVRSFQHLIIMGRQMRNDIKVKLKTPLSQATVLHRDKTVLDDIRRLSDYIKAELNFKSLSFSTEEGKFIDLYAKANYPALGKRLGKQMKHYANLIANLVPTDIDQLQQVGFLDIDGQRFSEEDIVIYRKAKEGVNAVSNRYISMEFEPKLTEELVAEGMIREVVSRIQKLRKSSGFGVTDKISVSMNTSDHVRNWIEKYLRYLQAETLATRVDFQLPANTGEQYILEMGAVSISVAKIKVD
ncbi:MULTISPECIES: isoleucine--tRNA ligase [Morganellaceae]|uniref:isoleucine--tRNA ligase n=1 Tax=Morganellaceae TaxID=1903414 RepID=UPI001C06C27F|nr:isoleucine--tRNA ligase [Proteus mirabilis]MBU3052064.1 isoleucine--tRNA ligase [Proteus mirabilis]|tara:strand:+ start:598 stop:3744 length:3147 start_codon:yes stop_codon:yes gene_type:complete